MALNRIARIVVLSLSFIFTFISTGLAQSSYYVEEPRLFYGGLLAGGNFSQVDGDNFAGYHKAGLNVGGIVYARMAEHLAASIEILFSQKGAKGNKVQYSNSRLYTIQKYNIDLNYAEVPIQINYFDKRKSHFGAGFSYSQLINAEERVQILEPFNEDLAKYPFKKFDINFLIGGNLHLYQGLFLNVRFQYSMLSVRKNYFPEFGRADQFNNMWTLRLMYLFN